MTWGLPPREFVYSGPSASQENGPEDEVLRIDVSEDEIAPDSPSPPPPRLRGVVVVPKGSWLVTRPRLILLDARPPLAERNGRPFLLRLLLASTLSSRC